MSWLFLSRDLGCVEGKPGVLEVIVHLEGRRASIPGSSRAAQRIHHQISTCPPHAQMRSAALQPHCSHTAGGTPHPFTPYLSARQQTTALRRASERQRGSSLLARAWEDCSAHSPLQPRAPCALTAVVWVTPPMCSFAPLLPRLHPSVNWPDFPTSFGHYEAKFCRMLCSPVMKGAI